MIIERIDSTGKEEHSEASKAQQAHGPPETGPPELQTGGGVRGEDDPPPMYVELEMPGSIPDMAPVIASASFSPPRQEPQLPKATNMVSCTKVAGSVKGTWMIDPSLVVPPIFLPPLPFGDTEVTRKNLFIKTNDGTIAADVTLVPSQSAPEGRSHTTFKARTLNGPVKFILRESANLPRLPVVLNIESMNGSIHVGIPRSFRGVIVGKSFHGSIKVSDAVNAQIQHDTTDGRSRRMFVGDFGNGEVDRSDEVLANTKNGHVKITYEHETPRTQPSGEASQRPRNSTTPSTNIDRASSPATFTIFSRVWGWFDL